MEKTPYKTLSKLSEDDRALLQAARDVARRAFNPVSHFQVGAAVRSLDGRVHVGTFLESSALPLGVCAEPAALLAALADGVRDFAAIAVVGGDPAAQATGAPVTPCGGCRQRIYDVTGGSAANIRVICSNLALEQVLDVRIADLLPLAFDPAILPAAAWQPPPIQVDPDGAGGDEMPPGADESLWCLVNERPFADKTRGGLGAVADETLPADRDDRPQLDTTVPQTARIWSYWLGGNDNYAVDRQVGDEILQVMPDLVVIARESRAFLARAVRYLAAEAGIRQFLDVGTGLPTANNTHEVAQAVAPEARIVYVDNDPLVLVHARALLTSSAEGATDYVDADARDTARVLREAARTLDLTRPVAVMMLGLLGHIVDDEQAQAVASAYLAAMPSGSYLTVLDGTDVIRSEEHLQAQRIWNQSAKPPYQLRSPEKIASFFDGLDLVAPGVVSAPRWRPDPEPSEPAAEVDAFCAVGVQP